LLVVEAVVQLTVVEAVVEVISVFQVSLYVDLLLLQ
jgi:hypothetical protein